MNAGHKVLVRAYRSEPLERIVCSSNERVVHVCHPDSYASYLENDGGAVGFPWEGVFVFDEEAYTALRRAWEDGVADLDVLWGRTKPHARSN